MYWINMIGEDGSNRADKKGFYCEYLSDITHIGDGDVSYTADNSEVTAAPMKCGDELLCLEDSSVWVYQSNDIWKQI